MSDIPRFTKEYDIFGISEIEYIIEDRAITPPSEDRHLDDIFPFHHDPMFDYE